MTKIPYADFSTTRPRVDYRSVKLPPSSLWPLTSLKILDKQIRKHPERQIVALAASYREFGFIGAIVVDGDGTIVSGVGRYLAAQRAGMAEVPVIQLFHLSKEQIRAFRIADNQIGDLSSFDETALAIELTTILMIDEMPIDALGFTTAEVDRFIESIGVEDKQSDPADLVPEPPAIPVTRTGDIWKLGTHRLACGSSLEAIVWGQLMNGATASMAFVDGPYNVPVDGHVSGLGAIKHSEFQMASGEMSEAEFTAFNETYFTRMSEYLKDGAVLFACMDWKHLPEIMNGAKAAGLQLINLCIWNKTNGGMGSLYRSKHEEVLVLKKGRAPHTNNVKLGATGRYRCNVWDYPGANSFGPSRMKDLKDHPTVKPTALVADAIRDVSNIGEIVIDAFMGSGTTILAAERTRRIAYGIEIEPSYVDVAIRRWSDVTGGEAVLASTGETFSQVRARREAEPSAAAEPTRLPIVARSRQRRAA